MKDLDKTKEQLVAEVVELREQLAGTPASGGTEGLLSGDGRFSLAFQASPDTIVVTRFADGLILAVNEGFTRNTGYSRDEVLGKSTSDLDIWVNDGARELFVQTLRDEGEVLNFESTFRESGNRIVTGRVSAQIIDIDGESCVLSIVRDISDLKRAQEALRESEEHFRTVVESLAEALIITDLDDVTQYANPRVTGLTGYGAHDLVGRRAYELLVQSDQWDEMRERNRQRAEGRAETYELQIYRRDGSSFWAEVHAAPYRDADGETIGSLAAVTDITGRRELEAQLRQSQKMEAVGQLAAGIAHNFNNMLQAVMGRLSVALEKVQGDVKDHLLYAEESSRKGSDIVRQLMLFAHHGRPGNFRPVNVSHALTDTADLCRRSFDRRIDVSLRVSETLPSVSGDFGQLQQVLLNVCLNARDALEGVTDRDPTIRIETDTLSDPDDDGLRRVEIRITDNGVGMDPEVRDQVFQPFFIDEGCRQGDGPGAGYRLRDRATAQGLNRVRE